MSGTTSILNLKERTTRATPSTGVFKHYKHRPGHPDWKALQEEAIDMVRKILEHMTVLTPLNRLKAGWRRTLAIAKVVKNLVRNKIRMARGNHDFVPLFYIYTMTNACNFSCTYCSNHRGAKYPELFKAGKTANLTTEQAKRLIWVMRDSSAIYFCGGEPTLRKDLPELLDYSTRLNMFNMINTNGSLIGDLLLRERYKDFLYKMDVVIISLDSLHPAKLARMYEVRENVAMKVLRNVLLLRILRNYVPFKLVANTVITRETIEDAFDILDWCNDLGITFSPVAMNVGQQPDEGLLQDTRYKELVDRILDRARMGYPMIASEKMLDRLLHARLERCYPTVFDHIDHDGRLFWPCKSYPKARMVPVLKYRNVDEVHRAASKIIDPYYFHGKGPGKCNGDCAWMQDCVTDFYASALIKGFFSSGLFSEIKGLLS